MLSLYDATVPSFLQVLRAVQGLLDKAESYCTDKGLPASDIIDARLAPDMFPFAYQIAQVARHSWGSVQGVLAGEATSDKSPLAQSFDELRAKLAEAEKGLAALDPQTLNARSDAQVVFSVPVFTRTFSASDFMLSFSQPNFHFHATIAYALMRGKGVEIGKRDYLGELRTL